MPGSPAALPDSEKRQAPVPIPARVFSHTDRMWIVYTYTDDDGRANHLVGPFGSRQDAHKWADEHANPNELWDVAPLKEPSL